MDVQTLVNLGLVLLFVLIGGVFAATEIALVSLRSSQMAGLERMGSRGARVAGLARDPNRFLAAVQIGVTVAGFFSAAYGGSTLAPDLAPHLEWVGLSADAAEATALVVMTLLIAYLSLVLGELAPKRLALQRAAGLSLAVAPVLDGFASLMRPVIWFLSVSTNAVVRVLGGDPAATGEQLTEDELHELVVTHEALEEQERRILRDVFAATETSLKEVMCPRGDVEFLGADLPLPIAAERVRELPFSRYPVTGEGFDDVVGVVHVRDLLGVTPGDPRRVRDVSRRVLMLPATNLVLPAVATMRHERIHLAVVVDEYGGTDGIVTLQDLLAEIVGDIHDEYAAMSTPTAADASVVPGNWSLQDFAEHTGFILDAGDYETVAGYVMARLERIPVVGDIATFAGGQLEVTVMKGPRIVTLTLEESSAGADETSASG